MPVSLERDDNQISQVKSYHINFNQSLFSDGVLEQYLEEIIQIIQICFIFIFIGLHSSLIYIVVVVTCENYLVIRPVV